MRGAGQVSPLRGIPTSRAYWELKAEQVLNRVFEPEKPIEVEVCDTPPSPAAAIERPQPTAPLRHRNDRSTRNRPTSRFGPVQHWVDQLRDHPSLLLAGAGMSALFVSGAALVMFSVWNQAQQAIRQERNMLMIERLRTMGPGTTTATPDAGQTAATPADAAKDGELPPPPSGEAWMEELASLPASGAPAADVLRVPVNGRITSPAPPPMAPAEAVVEPVGQPAAHPSWWAWCRCRARAVRPSSKSVAVPRVRPWARASAAAAGACARPVATQP